MTATADPWQHVRPAWGGAPASPAALAVAATADLAAGARWQPFAWHRLYDEYLVALARDPNENFLIIEAPIRHGKSKLGSVFLPAWWHCTYPDDPVIATSHALSLAESFSAEVREVVDRCGHMFPGHPKLARSSKAVQRWRLAHPHQGEHIVTSTGAPPTGRGARLIVIDDPYAGAKQAYSQSERDNVWRWWQTDIRGRLKPHGGAIVIIMSRWHEDDLVGRLLAAQEVGEEAGTGLEAFRWNVLHLPALADPTDDEPDPMGRARGEALWPEWFSAEHLRGLRDDPLGAGRLAFEAQYQGRPTTPEGGMFRVDSWNYVAALHHETLLEAHAGAVWVRRWDLASSEEKGKGKGKGTSHDPDWTAGVLMARTRDGRTFVVDARRIRAEPLGVQRFVRKTFEEDRERWGCESVRIARGMDTRWAHSEFSRLVLPDADFAAGTPERGPKDLRARPFAAQVEAGNVFLLGTPEGTPWIRDYVEEFRSFPHGTHDDWVDASALAYLDLATGANIGEGVPFVPRSRYRR